MNYKNIKNLLIPIMMLSVLFIGNICLAAFLQTDVNKKIDIQASQVGDIGGYEKSSNVYGLAQTVINAFLSLIGVILLAYLLYAGYKWMTAHGEEKKVDQAKETIQRAITGIIIIVAAYAISVFVMSRLEAGTLRGGSNTSTTLPVGQVGQ